jgi:hypothetical protein
MQRERPGGAGDASTLRAMQGLPEAALRRTVLGERLAQHDAGAGAALIEEIVRGAAMGDAASRSAAVALALWILAEPEGSAIVARIRAAAILEGRLAVAAILGAGPGRCALAARGRLAEIGIAVEGPLDVSFRSPWQASHRDRVRLHRLLQHHDPRMIRRLVASRWIRRKDIVAIASRRPTTEAIVRELCASPRWMLLAEVRQALAANPFTPASVVLPLLPTLPRLALRRLRAGAASATVAEAAQHLLDLGLPRASLP